MRGEGDRITADDVIRMGLARKHYWERHGTGQWGYGVALDVLALERRVAALERLSGAGKSAGEESDSPGEGWRWVEPGKPVMEGDEYLSSVSNVWCPSYCRPAAPYRMYRRRIDARSNHDAAPAARAEDVLKEPTGRSGGEPAGEPEGTVRTGDTQEPVAWAVMLAGGERIYDVYAIEEDAKAIDEAVTGNHGIVPLYRQPAITAEECEAIELAAYDHLYHPDPGGRAQWIREQLLGLLARTK
jgi:hypothetical protein